MLVDCACRYRESQIAGTVLAKIWAEVGAAEAASVRAIVLNWAPGLLTAAESCYWMITRGIRSKCLHGRNRCRYPSWYRRGALHVKRETFPELAGSDVSRVECNK